MKYHHKEYTPENITELKENEIFVFGSNTQGRHGAGAAKIALDKFGAIYGQSSGLQGNSFGIITTDLTNTLTKHQLEKHIIEGLIELSKIAKQTPDIKYYITKIGSGLAGFTIERMKHLLWVSSNYPDNIILPKEFT